MLKTQEDRLCPYISAGRTLFLGIGISRYYATLRKISSMHFYMSAVMTCWSLYHLLETLKEWGGPLGAGILKHLGPNERPAPRYAYYM